MLVQMHELLHMPWLGCKTAASSHMYMIATADKVEQLSAELHKSRRQSADSKSAKGGSDALCKQLRDKLEALQRAAATENHSLQVRTCS